MRGWLTSILLATVLVVALAVAVAGCGGQKRTIPTRKAQSFLAQLDRIGSQYDNGACTGAGDKVRALAAQARDLPRSVDATVKRNLEAGIARLQILVARNCQRPTPTNTTPTTPTTPTTTTNTAPTTPTAPTTTPTAPTTTPTTPTTTPTSPTTTPGGGGGGGVTVPGTIGGGGGG